MTYPTSQRGMFRPVPLDEHDSAARRRRSGWWVPCERRFPSATLRAGFAALRMTRWHITDRDSFRLRSGRLRCAQSGGRCAQDGREAAPHPARVTLSFIVIPSRRRGISLRPTARHWFLPISHGELVAGIRQARTERHSARGRDDSCPKERDSSLALLVKGLPLRMTIVGRCYFGQALATSSHSGFVRFDEGDLPLPAPAF